MAVILIILGARRREVRAPEVGNVRQPNVEAWQPERHGDSGCTLRPSRSGGGPELGVLHIFLTNSK